MRRGASLIWGATIGLAAASCGSPTIEEAAILRQAIVGGAEDVDDPAVVFIVIDVDGQLTAGSGTIISPHVVLTAAHVVSAAPTATYRVFYGRNWRDGGSSSDQWLLVGEVHADPAYNSRIATSTHDVGVLTLSVPAPIPPVAFNRAPADSTWVGAPIRMVGYGITSSADTSGSTAGLRREATATITTLNTLTFGTAMGSVPCGGDSGGPAFMRLKGPEILVGIDSNGDATCAGASFARVDTSAAFLDQWINAVDPGFLPDAGDDASEASAIANGDDAGVGLEDDGAADASAVSTDPDPVAEAPSSGGCAMSPARDKTCGWFAIALGLTAGTRQLRRRAARSLAARAPRAGCRTG